MLSCIEGKGGGKDIHRIAQNATLFANLLDKHLDIKFYDGNQVDDKLHGG